MHSKALILKRIFAIFLLTLSLTSVRSFGKEPKGAIRPDSARQSISSHTTSEGSLVLSPQKSVSSERKNSASKKSEVFKYVLDNGLTVLVRPTDTTQKVAVQIWYGVGSKHEGSGEKGIAHLIEHMLFKGTHKLSETDIKLIGQKFSADWNAATSYDYTKMEFSFPLDSWQTALPLLADCMCNCTFKQELLNSELKTVVQELKMYRDDHIRGILEELLSALYPDHPYHAPIIGYKHDLYNVSAETLKNFYKKHYVPNNATLIVVGKVEPSEVLSMAKKHFGSIPACTTYKQTPFFSSKDLKAQTITLYRDVKKPMVVLAFSIPGTKEKQDYTLSILHRIVSQGKTSRLHKKLVDELQLVDSITSLHFGLHDADIYALAFEPYNLDAVDEIIRIIQDEFRSLAQHGCTKEELSRSSKQFQMSFYNMLEDNEAQATFISDLYLATGDENHIYHMATDDYDTLNENIKKFVGSFLRPTLMYKGFVLPLPEEELQAWQALQQQADEADARILCGKVRNCPVEPGKYVHCIEKKAAESLPAVKEPQAFSLKNGMRVLYYSTKNNPIIRLALQLKVHFDYEPQDRPGLLACLGDMLREGGTQKRSALEFAQALDSMGASLSYQLSDGKIIASAMTQDLPELLQLMHEGLAQPAFNKEALLKIKGWMLSSYKSFLDDPVSIATRLQKQTIYGNHPNGQNHIADPESIEQLTPEDIINAYKTLLSPDGATLILVGDLEDHKNIQDLLESTLGTWAGPKIPNIMYPKISTTHPQTLCHYMNRDQIALSLAGLSISRFDADFDALQLYNTIIHERLFRLRERTGAFYHISASLLSDATKQPGLVSLATLVSQDRLSELVNLLYDFIEHDIDSLTNDDLEIARCRMRESIHQRYEDNRSIMETFLFLNRYQLPFDYFHKHLEGLSAVSLDQVKKAVKKVFNTASMNMVLVGRINNPDSFKAATSTQGRPAATLPPIRPSHPDVLSI